MRNRNRGLDARPLYQQVRDTLLDRIRQGAWKPGAALPNEFAIAEELGVSQGTARKALDSLAAEHVIVRRQGRGTFVAEHTPQHVLFRFFNIFEDAGQQVIPDSRDSKVSVAKASAPERRRLGLEAGSKVIRIRRMRVHDAKPFVSETITLPAAPFPGLENVRPIPNTLYDLFQKSFGVTVSWAEEQVTAVAASPSDAKALGIDIGRPLLRIDRLMYALADQPVEWRVSLCHLDGAHYLARLR